MYNTPNTPKNLLLINMNNNFAKIINTDIGQVVMIKDALNMTIITLFMSVDGVAKIEASYKEIEVLDANFNDPKEIIEGVLMGVIYE